MGALHLVVFVAGCLLFASLAFRQRGTFLERMKRLALFLGLLLVVGAIANGLWGCAVWGRLYFSTDYTFDFTPFWPVTQEAIESSFGGTRGQFFGVSLWQLQLVWLLFAAAVWTLTFILYRFFRGKTPIGLKKVAA